MGQAHEHAERLRATPCSGLLVNIQIW